MSRTTIEYIVYMDTPTQIAKMMSAMVGRNRDVIRQIGQAYNVTIVPIKERNCFEISGDRVQVVAAHECMGRAYSRRKQWVIKKCGLCM